MVRVGAFMCIFGRLPWIVRSVRVSRLLCACVARVLTGRGRKRPKEPTDNRPSPKRGSYTFVWARSSASLVISGACGRFALRSAWEVRSVRVSHLLCARSVRASSDRERRGERTNRQPPSPRPRFVHTRVDTSSRARRATARVNTLAIHAGVHARIYAAMCSNVRASLCLLRKGRLYLSRRICV